MQRLPAAKVTRVHEVERLLVLRKRDDVHRLRAELDRPHRPRRLHRRDALHTCRPLTPVPVQHEDEAAARSGTGACAHQRMHVGTRRAGDAGAGGAPGSSARPR